jgi:twitching motility protein PilT
MARIDSLLSLLDRQGANELRLGSDREPQMFASGTPKKLTIPKTSTETVRELLGELLPPERERVVAQQGQTQFPYEAPTLGPFLVSVTRRGPPAAVLVIDVVILRGGGHKETARTAAARDPVHLSGSAVEHLASPSPRVAPSAPPAVDSDAVSPELASLAARAAALRGSDIHLLESEVPVLRVDGRLVPFVGEQSVAFLRLFGPRLTAEIERRLSVGLSADLGVSVDGVGRLRIHVFRSSAGRAAAIRLLPPSPPALSQLGLPVPIDDLIDLPHGLILVCGPTGSGKSTTLAALSRAAVDRKPTMLITIEDPIEYVLGGRGARGVVRQRQVGSDVKDFASALRDALRQDPDILLVGEMRDPETISLALTAAETGHLVLASLHCRSAASAVERIVDTYPPERQGQIRVQLADALRVVVAQRLVPRASGDGRTVAVEVMRVNHAVASAIREAKTGGINSAIQAGKKEGMIPLERCLSDLVQRRVISLEDARAVANDPTVLTAYMSG